MQRSLIVRPGGHVLGADGVHAGRRDLPRVPAAAGRPVAAGGWRERAARLRHDALWWPVIAFVVWTLVVLAIGPQYPQTPSNLVHGLRIAATVDGAGAHARRGDLGAARILPDGAVQHRADRLVLLIRLSLPRAVARRAPAHRKQVDQQRAAVHDPRRDGRRLRPGGPADGGATGSPWRRSCRSPPWSRSSPSRCLRAPRSSALLLVIPAACVHQWRRQLKVLAAVMVVGGAVVAAGLWIRRRCSRNSNSAFRRSKPRRAARSPRAVGSCATTCTGTPRA